MMGMKESYETTVAAERRQRVPGHRDWAKPKLGMKESYGNSRAGREAAESARPLRLRQT